MCQKVTKTRPTREGKGGIQDGILLEKKRILQKPNLLRGKGACGKETRRTLRRSTRSAGPRAARGRIFGCILVAFRHHFGQGFALRAPSWRLLVVFWSPKVPRCTKTRPRATCNAPFGTLLAQFCTKKTPLCITNQTRKSNRKFIFDVIQSASAHSAGPVSEFVSLWLVGFFSCRFVTHHKEANP